MKKSPKTQTTAHADALPTPSATDLMVEIENGNPEAAIAQVRLLSQGDFIQVLRAVQTLEKALSSYALSWQGAECWGVGQPYPDEQKAKAKAAGA